MANYINGNMLCQAYIHVEPDEITQELTTQLQNHLESFVKTRVDFFLYSETDINIELQEGSIKLRITVFGTMMALFSAVANYPEFRSGAISMYDDVKRLSEYVISESVFSTKAKHHQIIRVEARTGVIGSTRKIISKLDMVNNNNGKVMADTLTKYINQSGENIEILLNRVKTEEDKNFIKNGFQEIISELPKKPTPPNKKTNTDEQIKLYESSVDYITKIVE